MRDTFDIFVKRCDGQTDRLTDIQKDPFTSGSSPQKLAYRIDLKSFFSFYYFLIKKVSDHFPFLNCTVKQKILVTMGLWFSKLFKGVVLFLRK